MSKTCLKLTLAVLVSATIMRGERLDAQNVPSQIAAVQVQVASLQATVSTLQTEISSLQTQLAAVKSNHALLLGPFVNVDPNPEIGVIGPNIIFSGANIHIVSGSGATNDNGNPTGLGNLIIGYDENPMDGTIPTSFTQGDRTGSHNLLIGRWNKFDRSSFGGFVAGEMNSFSSEGSSIVGGWRNIADAQASVVLGGEFNIASGNLATVSGGENSYSRAVASSITGGLSNICDGNFAIIIGGQNLSLPNNLAIVPQPPFPQ